MKLAAFACRGARNLLSMAEANMTTPERQAMSSRPKVQ
jgi:hypothetical protein